MHFRHPGRGVRHPRGKATSFELCSHDLGGDRRETIGKRDILRVAHVGRWIGQVWMHGLRHWRWLIALVAHLHLCLHLIQTHHLASGRHGWHGHGHRLGLLLGNPPNARFRLQVGNETGVGIFLVTATLGERWLRLRSGLNLLTSDGDSLGVLQGIANLLFADCIGDGRSLAEEIEVLADSSRAGTSRAAATESVVVEGILIIIELVAQAIVGILKIDARI